MEAELDAALKQVEKDIAVASCQNHDVSLHCLSLIVMCIFCMHLCL